MDDLFDIEDKFRKVQKERCDGCKYCKVVHANGGFSFYGCHHKPYRGKWVAEIKDCPNKHKDEVRVVRCKDCKHYMLWEDSEDKRTCSKSIGLMISDPDDFCSYGERKDNGTV